MTADKPIRVINDLAANPDALTYLEEQHQQVRLLLDQVSSATGEARQQAFDELREMLARHETAEEMILRPMTRRVPEGEKVAAERMHEENEAKEELAKLEKLDVVSPEFTRSFEAFRAAVIKHAEAEERLEFPALRANCNEEELTSARSKLEKAEKTAPTHPHPSAKSTTMNYVAGPFAAMVDRVRDALSS